MPHHFIDSRGIYLLPSNAGHFICYKIVRYILPVMVSTYTKNCHGLGVEIEFTKMKGSTRTP